MALTVKESIAVNTLLSFVIGEVGPAGYRHSPKVALQAAQMLSAAGHKALGAGVHPHVLEKGWPKKQPLDSARERDLSVLLGEYQGHLENVIDTHLFHGSNVAADPDDQAVVDAARNSWKRAEDFQLYFAVNGSKRA